jgi:hypothetical protein
VVGANGFEPSTSWSRTRRASQAALRPESYFILDLSLRGIENICNRPCVILLRLACLAPAKPTTRILVAVEASPHPKFSL